MIRPVYLDHNATTPVDPRVVEEMLPYFSLKYGNPSSIDHFYGNEASSAVEEARRRVAELVNCDESEVVFTSGASEADNLAILGTVGASIGKRHIITCATEHKAVLEPVRYLEQVGASATVLPVDRYGLVDQSKLRSAITKETVLLSIMTANNEIGTIAPIKEIVDIAHSRGILVHTDAAQAAGHIDVDMKGWDLDLLSLSSHKMYGPKGVGALIVRRRRPSIRLDPMIRGGGHERGLRSGTLNVPGIVGLGAAASLARTCYKEEAKKLASERDHMYKQIADALGGVEMNGHPNQRLPHNLNVFIDGVQNKALQHALRNDVAFSTGSACETAKVEPSHVLAALGYDLERIESSIRIGLGRFNTVQEIEFASNGIIEASERLRRVTR